jgi:hypothetical protein
LPVLERIFYCDGGRCHASYDSVVFDRCCNYFMGVTMKVYVLVYEGDALGVYLTPEAATLAGCALEDEEFIVSECTFHGEEE